MAHKLNPLTHTHARSDVFTWKNASHARTYTLLHSTYFHDCRTINKGLFHVYHMPFDSDVYDRTKSLQKGAHKTHAH